MATETETGKIGDIVKMEAPNNYCRETKTVLDGETLVLGQVAKLNSASKVVALSSAAVNEVQTITMTGFAAGTCRIKLTDPVTGTEELSGEIANDASTSAIKTALEACSIVATDDIAVGGTDIDNFTLTFQGNNWAGVNVAPVEIQFSSDATADTEAIVTETTRGGGLGSDAELILLEAASPSGADGAAGCLVRGPAVVDIDQLTFPTGAAAAVTAARDTVGIVCREEPDTQETMPG